MQSGYAAPGALVRGRPDESTRPRKAIMLIVVDDAPGSAHPRVRPPFVMVGEFSEREISKYLNKSRATDRLFLFSTYNTMPGRRTWQSTLWLSVKRYSLGRAGDGNIL